VHVEEQALPDLGFRIRVGLQPYDVSANCVVTWFKLNANSPIIAQPSTARASTPFSIEMLMSIAAVGAVIIGATDEAG
jgi:hypothetical protein